jgi:hypothetical protein
MTTPFGPWVPNRCCAPSGMTGDGQRSRLRLVEACAALSLHELEASNRQPYLHTCHPGRSASARSAGTQGRRRRPWPLGPGSVLGTVRDDRRWRLRAEPYRSMNWKHQTASHTSTPVIPAEARQRAAPGPRGSTLRPWPLGPGPVLRTVGDDGGCMAVPPKSVGAQLNFAINAFVVRGARARRAGGVVIARLSHLRRPSGGPRSRAPRRWPLRELRRVIDSGIS